MGHAVFLSYSRRDQNAALELVRLLAERSIAVWIDQLAIEAGQLWDTEVEGALAAAKEVVVLLSPSAVNSKHVRNEIRYALDKGKRVLTVLLAPCDIPMDLIRYQHIDCTHGLGAGVELLVSALAPADSNPPPPPESPPPKPPPLDPAAPRAAESVPPLQPPPDLAPEKRIPC